MLTKRDVKDFGQKAKAAVTTREGFKNAIEVQTSDFAQSTHGFIWSNAHMDPSPPSERTWAWFHYFALWFSYSFTAGGWSAASSLLSLNLNWWQAIVVCFVGATVSGITLAINSRQSSVYHIGFPTVQRVSFGTSIDPWSPCFELLETNNSIFIGMYGSLFPVFTRAVVAVLWIGVTVYQSSLFLDVALRYAPECLKAIEESKLIAVFLDACLAIFGTKCQIPFPQVLQSPQGSLLRA